MSGKKEAAGAQVVTEEDEILQENVEGDEELLDQLLKANEAIDTLEHHKVTTDLNPSIPRKPNQDELLRQQVAQVLRKLELEVS